MTVDPSTQTLAEAAAEFEESYAHVFGEGILKRFRNRTWNIRFLDVNDLIELAKRFGGVSVDTDQLSHVRFLLYLALRKSDPRLSAADIENGKFKITEKWVGSFITLATLKDPETTEFLDYILTGSGMKETEQEQAESEKKDE